MPLRQVVLPCSFSQEYIIVRSFLDAKLRWQHYQWPWFEILYWNVIGKHFAVLAVGHTGLLPQMTGTQDIYFHNHLPHLKILPHGSCKKEEVEVS